MNKSQGFIYCASLNGQGAAQEIKEDHAAVWHNNDSVTWFHLDYTDQAVKDWLSREHILSELTIEILTSQDTRPRSITADQGLLICLRGVNCNPGADPDDMVSLRLWIHKNRIITMRHRRVEAINDIRNALTQGQGPNDIGDFLVVLCERLTDRMADVVGDIDDSVDALEDQILEKERAALRSELSRVRRMIIGLRRHLVPQRELLSRLQNERVEWLSDADKFHIREVTERVTRCLEDLDAARDRAAIAQEELNARLSEQMNQTLYVMSIVATIFLPLGLLTGLLGINVGGIPGTENPWAFFLVCLLLGILAFFVYFIFKRKQVL
ncbi:MAG: zinc transporter ZntB [Phycisphaerae bacterium]|nr:zinc transporter ZntB [Phycisphaerae bacterium]